MRHLDRLRLADDRDPQRAELFRGFHELVTRGTVPETDDGLDRLAVFSGVREFPMRVKCATLAWHAAMAALEAEAAPNDLLVSTETP